MFHDRSGDSHRPRLEGHNLEKREKRGSDAAEPFGKTLLEKRSGYDRVDIENENQQSRNGKDSRNDAEERDDDPSHRRHHRHEPQQSEYPKDSQHFERTARGDQRYHDDKEIENVPAALEVFLSVRHDFRDGFDHEDPDYELVEKPQKGSIRFGDGLRSLESHRDSVCQDKSYNGEFEISVFDDFSDILSHFPEWKKISRFALGRSVSGIVLKHAADFKKIPRFRRGFLFSNGQQSISSFLFRISPDAGFVPAVFLSIRQKINSRALQNGKQINGLCTFRRDNILSDLIIILPDIH